jgi:hypothetical protein
MTITYEMIKTAKDKLIVERINNGEIRIEKREFVCPICDKIFEYECIINNTTHMPENLPICECLFSLI